MQTCQFVYLASWFYSNRSPISFTLSADFYCCNLHIITPLWSVISTQSSKCKVDVRGAHMWRDETISLANPINLNEHASENKESTHNTYHSLSNSVQNVEKLTFPSVSHCLRGLTLTAKRWSVVSSVLTSAFTQSPRYGIY